MKKNAKTSGRKGTEKKCGDGGECTGNNIPQQLSATEQLGAECAAEIAGAVALSESTAEELGRKTAEALAMRQLAQDDRVTCAGPECRTKFKMTERTLVIKDSDEPKPLCHKCVEAANRAGLKLLPRRIWEERKQKFNAKVEELRKLDIGQTGGTKKIIHEYLLDLDADVLDRAFVVSTKSVDSGEEKRGVIMPNAMCLAAFLKTHDKRNYRWDRASEILDAWEKEEREIQRREQHFRAMADAKRKQFDARGERRRERDNARVAGFRAMASGGNGRDNKPMPTPVVDGGNAFASHSMPVGAEQNGGALTHSPFAALNLNGSKDNELAKQ